MVFETSAETLMEECGRVCKGQAMALNDSIGSPLNYPWPKTPGILSAVNSEQVLKAIDQNEKWFVSEKLDGCNNAISSGGWVASRSQIIAHLKQEKEFGSKKILQVTVEKLKPLFEKIVILNNTYLHQLNMDLTKKDQIILYGELILPGTSNSKHDVYKNKENGFKVGQLYVFGMGFVFENPSDNKKNLRELKNLFDNVQVHRSKDNSEYYFIVPINKNQKPWFVDCGIDTVVFHPAEKFVDIITRRNKGNLISPLESRKIEGYVLHDSTCQMLKWKYQFKPTDYHDALVEAFKNEWTANDNQIKVIDSLESLYKLSECFVTEYEKWDLEDYMEQFMTSYLRQIENSLEEIVENENQESKEMTFLFNCWLEHARYKIMYQLMPSSKCTFDPKIKLEIIDFISKYLKTFISNYFLAYQ